MAASTSIEFLATPHRKIGLELRRLRTFEPVQIPDVHGGGRTGLNDPEVLSPEEVVPLAQPAA